MKKIILTIFLMSGLIFGQTDLSNVAHNASYGGLWHFANNTGVTSSFLAGYDGKGNALPLQMSTTAVKFPTPFTLGTVSVTATGTEMNYLVGVTSLIQTQLNSKVALTSFSSSATGLTYTNTTGVFSLTSGYTIPADTSIAHWRTAYGRVFSVAQKAKLDSLTVAISILNGTTASFTSALKSTYDGYATSKVNKADSTGVNGYATQDDLLTKVNKADSTGVHGYATQDDLNSKEATITTLSIAKGGTNNATPAQNKFLFYNGTKILASGKDSTSFILATNLDTDTTLTANSDTKVVSQKAIKTYISHNISATQLRGKGVSAAFVDGYRLYYDAAKDSLMWTGSTGSVGNADSLGNQPAAYYIARSDSTDATSYTTKKQFNDGQLLDVKKSDSTGVHGYATQDDLLVKVDKADTTDATSYTTKKQFNDGQALKVNLADSTGVHGYATQDDLLAKSPLAGSSSIVTTGALNSGSISSGFGTINIGTDSLKAGHLKIGGNGTTIDSIKISTDSMLVYQGTTKYKIQKNYASGTALMDSVRVLTSDFTTQSDSFVDITGLSISVAANKKYLVTTSGSIVSNYIASANCYATLSIPTSALISGSGGVYYTSANGVVQIGSVTQRAASAGTIGQTSGTFATFTMPRFVHLVETAGTAGQIKLQIRIDNSDYIGTAKTGTWIEVREVQ